MLRAASSRRSPPDALLTALLVPPPPLQYFPENPPARATFAVAGLPLGAKVEIEATALL